MVAFADRWIQVRLTPLGDDGEVQGSVAVLYDVTARERLEAVRKELVANVSHELRTPITTVELYVESLLEWGLDDPRDARQKLHVVADEVDRMARLINDLLELSKLDDRKIVRNRQSVDMRTLCRTVQERFDERAHQKGVRIILDPSANLPEEPFHAEVDADRILQVLTNLVSNSLDFTLPGGEIRLGVEASAHDTLSIEVSDTGVGIPARDLPRIFDRFYRVEGSRSREHGGSGLGLAIAKEIVEAHGGTIDIESQEGVGTTIRFTLPREAQP
jgi:two-component system sensor histidine kinase VicK